MGRAKKATAVKANPATAPTQTAKAPQVPGDTIKPNYRQREGGWWLFDEAGQPVRELTVIETSAAMEAGLIVVEQPKAKAAPKALPVVEEPKPKPRKEGPHCVICVSYTVARGENPLASNEGVCAQTNATVKAEDVCKAFRVNEALRD
jgi:hypothetical protein